MFSNKDSALGSSSKYLLGIITPQILDWPYILDLKKYCFFLFLDF